MYPTGSNPAYYDVQLVPGVTEHAGQPNPATVMRAARRLVESCGDLQSNPSYAGVEEKEDT